jgi:DNA-binding NtrC family response regulator
MPTPLRALIADDSEDDALLLLRQLSQSGWEVSHLRVDSAAAMIAALDQGGWDVVISDFSMPQFGGFDALALVRQRSADLPFILVSGNVGEEMAVQAMKNGASDYLFKGNLKRLGPAVERELCDAQQRREGRRTQDELHRRDAQLAEAQKLAQLGTWHIDFATQTAVLSEESGRIVGLPSTTHSIPLVDFWKCFHQK